MTKQRRPYGSGSIDRSGKNPRARVYVAGERRGLGTYQTDDDADATLGAFAALRSSGAVEVGGETLRQFGERWLNRVEIDGTMRDVKNARSRWQHVERAAFIDRPLVSIRRADVRSWLDRLTAVTAGDRRGKRRIGWQTRKHCLTLLRSCLTAAVDDELLDRNPASGIKFRKPADAVERWTYLTSAEQTALLTVDADLADRLLVAFALGSGLRQGEQWNLELRDVHIDDAQPWLFVRWGSKGKPPKNGRTRRVELFGLALAALRQWLALLPRWCKANPHGLAFPTVRGCRRAKSKQPRGWQAMLAGAGLVASKREDGMPVRWHDLRHTCASSLVAGWWGRRWSLQEVRDALGHRSINTTERYAHLAPSVLAEAANATSNRPPIARGQIGPVQDLACFVGRATCDSNARPSASEAAGKFKRGAGLDPLAGDVRAIAAEVDAARARYLRAIASRNRFAHRYGIELAEAVGRLTAAVLAERDTKPARRRA